MKNGFALLAAAGLLCSCEKELSLQNLPRIQAEEAFAYAERSITFQDRFSGSESIRKYGEWIADQARTAGAKKVKIDSFEDETPEGRITFRNISAEIPGRSGEFVIIAAHYDTKKFTGFQGFQGANDGASGAGTLLAMIRTLSAWKEPLPYTIRFLFLDGEECRVEYGEHDGLHGSRHAAERISASGETRHCRAMILLDMIGDKDLNLTLPRNGDPVLTRKVENLCGKLSVRCRRFQSAMLDDHVPFLKHNIPAIDLIDFEYGPDNSYWHTEQDSLDKISGRSMKAVADLAIALIWNLP